MFLNTETDENPEADILIQEQIIERKPTNFFINLKQSLGL